jgi:heterodisulfide reductase subunit A
MKVGVYFCRCGGVVADKIDGEALTKRLSALPDVAYVTTVDLACSDDGKTQMVADLKDRRPDRVVVMACSPREHEETFRGVLAAAGMNAFLMQMVNVREHIAWVTTDPAAATDKAFFMTRAAVARVGLQEPLTRQEIEVNPDILVIGAGPAGLKAAMTLAEAGRKVVLVDRNPILGGMPVRYDEIFPKMECGPCVLEPFMAEALHGPHAANIEMHLLTEVVEVAGSFGSFSVKMRQAPRFVDLATCIGCASCIEPCPASHPNPANCGMSNRKAMDFVFFGGLPNAPYLDPNVCLRTTGQDPTCEACKQACPVEGAVKLDDAPAIVERQVGAILLAVGSTLYDCRQIPQLGFGTVPGVVTSLEFERLAAGQGPTGGEIRLPDRTPPERVAIVHCVGSLDEQHKPYCSGICCMTAFKFNKLLAHKLPSARVSHYFRTLVMAGKDDHLLYRQALARAETTMVPYQALDELKIEPQADGRVTLRKQGQAEDFDMVVLMPALELSDSSRSLCKLLDVGVDRNGFCEELHGRVDATKSKVRGVYLAGACQSPMDLGRAMTQGSAAAAAVMATLVPGRKLTLEAIHAEVDAQRCAGCRSCVAVCPYKAVSFDSERGVAEVSPVRCLGCGTCVAACPAGAIKGHHFSNQQILAEIEGALP